MFACYLCQRGVVSPVYLLHGVDIAKRKRVTYTVDLIDYTTGLRMVRRPGEGKFTFVINDKTLVCHMLCL